MTVGSMYVQDRQPKHFHEHDSHYSLPYLVIGSHRYIPPGTSFWIPTYTMHRDPRNFSPTPDTFWPERWLMAAGIHNDSDGQTQVLPSATESVAYPATEEWDDEEDGPPEEWNEPNREQNTEVGVLPRLGWAVRMNSVTWFRG